MKLRHFFALVVLVSLGPIANARVLQPKQTYKNKYFAPIQLTGFIPDNNIPDPTPVTGASFVYRGDDRPFGPEIDRYRIRQKVTLIPSPSANPLGYDPATLANLVQATEKYDKASSINEANGKISPEALADTHTGDNYLKVAEGTATTEGMHINPLRLRPGERVVQVAFSGSVENPIPLFSCSIDYNLVLTVNGANKAQPRYSLSGERDRYPAYEMALGKQILYPYNPNDFEVTVEALCALSPTSIQTEEGDIK